MTTQEAYRVLNISEGAAFEEIKRAYRIKAREFHPDRNLGADAGDRMAEVNRAYSTLTENTIVEASIRETFSELFGSALDDLKI